MIRKIAILTSGGDAPGMNSAVRAIVKKAKVNNIETFLVFDGYKGLHNGQIFPSDQVDLDSANSRGGTIIGTARYMEFKDPKVRQEAKEKLNELEIEALVVIGGDGSYQGAQLLHDLGVKTIALPGTIDNDIASTDYTIGYDTALNTIVDSIEKVRDTMNSHHRAAIIEVMGHGCGDLALNSAIATGAELVVTNESQKSIEEIAKVIKTQKFEKNKRSIIVILSEGIYDDHKELENEISKLSGVVTRVIKLAHTQRGGTPTAFERILASNLGIEAVKLLLKGESGLALGVVNGKIVGTPIPNSLSIPRESKIEITKEINNINQN